jgi:6-phosphogluconolactonase
VSFNVEVLSNDRFAQHAAARITRALPDARTVVLTGGTTAEKIYHPMAEAGAGWADVEVFFSDERCVPPDDDRSNFGMASRILLDGVGPRAVHRMRGEDPPDEAARDYADEIAPFLEGGLDLVLLGMGADCHICAMFPGSPALTTDVLCLAIERPDGMTGLTLTPPAVTRGREILLLVSGSSKAEAVRRVLEGDEEPATCPARLLGVHPNVTFLLDEDAASALSR